MIRLALVGYGKIAQDQHIPNISTNPDFELTAIVSTSGSGPDHMPVYRTLDALLAQQEIDAVVIATPALPRPAIARRALEAGLHVFLEKPPAVTLGDVEVMAAMARQHGCTLFTSWHAQANPATTQAAAIVHSEGLAEMDIMWREDVEQWHPGQQWIWQPGGFGVMDAGINALSIAVALCPDPIRVEKARFVMHSSGLQPISATLLARSGTQGRIEALFDWQYKAQPQWTIHVKTLAGSDILLEEGGARFLRNGNLQPQTPDPLGEYRRLYAQFAALIHNGQSNIDVAPLRIVADMWLLADHEAAKAL